MKIEEAAPAARQALRQISGLVRLSEALTELEDLDKVKKELESDIDKLKRSRGRAKSDLDAAAQALEDAKASHAKTLAGMDEEVRAAKAEADRAVKHHRVRLDAARADFETALADLKAAHEGDVKAVTDDLADKRKEIAAAQKQLRELQSQIAAIKERFA